MNRELVCPVCGKEFVTDKNAKKYCSSRCRKKANSLFNNSVVRELCCAWCGDYFVSSRTRKYCSKECRLCANGRLATKQKKVREPILTLNQVAILSRQVGLSYGQYVNKFQLQ